MKRTAVSILIVDDDKELRETLSTILQSRGYQVTGVATASEALEKAKTRFFDVLLLDIRLPDMEGTRLLSRLQKIASEALKIIITGYPSVRNAAEALNIGANSFLTKPINPDLLLKTIENKLREREQKEIITGRKLTELVRQRLRKTQLSEFEEFLERNTVALTSFGLNKTQAKIYIGLDALGGASASEIASLVKIRREEVYRIMPELEHRGLATRKFGTPRRFTAIKPRVALKILTETRIRDMKEEVSNLKHRKSELTLRLEKTSSGIEEEKSIEMLTQQDNVIMRVFQMTKKAKQQIMLASSAEQLETMFPKNNKKIIGTTPNQISIRIIIGAGEPDEGSPQLDEVQTLRLFQFFQVEESKIELRKMQVLPFNLLMVDNEEAIWGEFQPEDASRKILWTNDSIQIGILRRAFENLWLESGNIEGNISSSGGHRGTEVVAEKRRITVSKPKRDENDAD